MTDDALVTTDTKKSIPQGVKFIGGDTDYITEDIDADAIVRYSVQNFLFARTKAQQMNLIFPKPYKLTVYDANGEIDEDVSTDLRNMCSAKGVNLWQKMQFAYSDVFECGAMFANPVWKYVDNVYTLVELNHLPWESFDCNPSESFKVSSELLTGVGINEKGEFKFYQNDLDEQPVELTNVIMIKNPMTKGITGTPLCLPILPLISGTKFSMNAQMQKVNRVGAPMPHIQLVNPKDANANNGNISDVEYANLYYANMSKDIGMPLRESMVPVDTYMKDNGSAIETIEYLNKQIVDFFSPSSLIQKDGNTLGGSDSSELGLLMRYVSSQHEWIENPFEELLQPYFDGNGYVGYRVEIEIPEPEIDNTEQDLEAAKVMITAPGAIKANELRKLLKQDELEELEDKYLSDLVATPTNPLTAFENSMARPTVQEAEVKSEEEQKDIWEEAFKKAVKLAEGVIE